MDNIVFSNKDKFEKKETREGDDFPWRGFIFLDLYFFHKEEVL